MLERGEDVAFAADKEAALAPRVLELERLEVVAEAAFAGTDDGDEAKVLQLVDAVHRAALALEHDGHVELLDDQVDHFTGRGP